MSSWEWAELTPIFTFLLFVFTVFLVLEVMYYMLYVKWGWDCYNNVDSQGQATGWQLSTQRLRSVKETETPARPLWISVGEKKLTINTQATISSG